MRTELRLDYDSRNETLIYELSREVLSDGRLVKNIWHKRRHFIEDLPHKGTEPKHTKDLSVTQTTKTLANRSRYYHTLHVILALRCDEPEQVLQ